MNHVNPPRKYARVRGVPHISTLRCGFIRAKPRAQAKPERLYPLPDHALAIVVEFNGNLGTTRSVSSVDLDLLVLARVVG